MANNKLLSFGDFSETLGYRVVNERVIRAHAGMMFLMGSIASINGFILKQFHIIPYITGFLLISFLISVLINPKLSPLYILATLIVRKQKPIWVGAIQKRFAWSLGIALSGTIFSLSLLLVNNVAYFNSVCMLCLICLFLLFFETAFGICIGCKLYDLALVLKLMKRPEIKPACIGDSCDI